MFMDGRNPGSGEETEARIRQLTQGPPEFAQAARQAARQPIRQFRAVVQTLPPGKYWLTIDPPMESLGLEIAFADAAGRHWVRRVTGELCERDTGALHYCDIASPVEYHLLNQWN